MAVRASNIWWDSPVTPTPSRSFPDPALSRRGLLTAAAAGAALALSGCVPASNPGAPKTSGGTEAAPTPSSTGPSIPAPPSPAQPGRAPLRLLVYGDSITRGGENKLVVGSAPVTSWLGHLGSGLLWVGGAARNGGTAAHLQSIKVSSPPADLAVYFVGTNDLLRGRSVQRMVGEIQAFHESLPPESRPRAITLVTVGPMGNRAPAKRLVAWNQELWHAAKTMGWGWVDPWVGLRQAGSGQGYGQWVRADQHVDDLHPTAAGAADLGAGMTSALLRLAQKRGLTRPLPNP